MDMDEVLALLKRDAKHIESDYNKQYELIPDPNSKAFQQGPKTKPNKRFLKNLLTDTKGHNVRLLEKEKAMAERRIGEIENRTRGEENTTRDRSQSPSHRRSHKSPVKDGEDEKRSATHSNLDLESDISKDRKHKERHYRRDDSRERRHRRHRDDSRERSPRRNKDYSKEQSHERSRHDLDRYERKDNKREHESRHRRHRDGSPERRHKEEKDMYHGHSSRHRHEERSDRSHRHHSERRSSHKRSHKHGEHPERNRDDTARSSSEKHSKNTKGDIEVIQEPKKGKLGREEREHEHRDNLEKKPIATIIHKGMF